jgi:hypothetical protein
LISFRVLQRADRPCGNAFCDAEVTTIMDNYHLLPHGERWRLTQEGGENILGDFDTKDDALGDCIAIVRDCSGSLTVHRADGTIEQEFTYPCDAGPAETRV